MSSLQAITVVTVVSSLLFGMLLALLGSIKMTLSRRLELSETSIGNLMLILNLALIPMMLFCGVLLDKLGVRLVLFAGSVLTCLALFAIAHAPTLRRLQLAVFLAGLGGAALCVASVVLMPHAFFAPSEDLSATLYLGYVAIALGALLTPPFASTMLRSLDFRRAMLILSVMSLVPALLALTPSFGRPLTELVPIAEKGKAFLSDGAYWNLLLAGMVFFFYVPLEAAVGMWTTTYLTDMGHKEGSASWVLAGFWTTLLSSRLLFAYLRPGPEWDPWLIVGLALATAAVMGNLAGAMYRSNARIALLMLGFVLGPIAPTLVAVVFREYSSERGTAYSIVFAMGSAGCLLLAPIFASMARRSHVKAALKLPVALAVGLTLAAIVFGLAI